MPTISEALQLARSHHQAGRLELAEEIYRRILALEPDHPEALHLSGVIAHQQGRHAAAIHSIGRAIASRPSVAEYHNNLGLALSAAGRSEEAAASYRRALALRPDMASAHNNLGLALCDLGMLDEAIACYRAALQSRPQYAEAHVNLGIALEEQGRPADAVACYRQALLARPDWHQVHSHLLHALHFCPGCDARAIYEEHCRWDRQYAEPLRRIVQPHANDRSPDRRLRVGYVSPNFRAHPVGRFLLPLLESHDRRQFEVFCYSSVRVPDAITDRSRTLADTWRDVPGLSDDQLADCIRQDRIDILVDLTMHMEDSRLLVFARKPAPVQVTYLAYCSTTGLETMDYRLTDPHLDPPGDAEPYYSEQSIWLPDTYWCYRPVIQTPAVTDLPARRAGHVTFGSLNHFCKVSQPTLAAWSRLLQQVPHSRLLLHAAPGSHRDRVRELFARDGVSPDRVTFAESLPTPDYFRLYQQIDVGLDPFPYGGGTTTCDALWMGVPVVSLAGQTAVSRGGLSILSNAGLTDLVARDLDRYVAIAADLAGDLDRLSRLRATLRDRIEKSPLADAPRFARNVEAAYRQMWRQWSAR